MDVYEASQPSSGEIQQRPPWIPSERNNNGGGFVRRNSRSSTREVNSRYKSPVPSSPSVPRRCPSPNLTRTTTGSTPTTSSVPKRAHSVERKRPCTPPSPPSPSTPPTHDSCSADIQKRTGSGRFPDSLWPSTMRSLSVSFQSDSISIPISKREREKPVTHGLSDRTLKPSSNVAHKCPEAPVALLRKPMPERKRSPLKGKNVSDQSENSKPVDSLHARLVDQHRWPSRTGGKVSSNVMSRSVDLTDSNSRTSASISRRGLSSVRRAPGSDGTSKPIQKSASDAASLLTTQLEAYSAEVNSRWLSGLHKSPSSSSSERVTFSNTTAVRSQSLPVPGSRPASPSKSSALASSKGASPSRARPSTPPSRGTSPSRIRQTTSTTSQSCSSTSVLSYIADFRKGKKGSNQLEDAHHLRLLYNRHLQWRFANARADDALYMQSVIAEEGLYNVGRTISDLWDLIIKKRINVQQLKLELKLNAALNNQMNYLDDWALLERDHSSSLSRVIEDLEASTLRLPVTAGARADIENVKVAICSAADVVQAMGSSLCSLHSRVEGRNSLVSGLADVVALERAILGECEALLASTADMQVEEYSVWSQLIQFKHDLTKD